MNAPASPRVSRTPTLPLVWIVPLVALAVGGWMVARELRNRGPEIQIAFTDGSGVEAGRTVLEHKGVAVGLVRKIRFKEDLSGVLVSVRLKRDAAAIAAEGAQFWIVNPEIGFSGVRGLDTLLTGARIRVLPGKGPPALTFNGRDSPPPLENPAEGRAFMLQADRLGSLSPGAPVFYREVKVGIVETSRLAENAGSVLIRIRIHEPYVDLVRTNTRFWNAGGISFRLGLLGAEVKSTSLESIFTGGVAFATPDQPGPPALPGTQFRLFLEADRAWLEWRPQISIHPPDESPPTDADRLGPLGDAILATGREDAEPR